MINKIYYAGFYDSGPSNRMCSLSAVVKMDYIVDALNQAKYNVEIISPSFILENRYQFHKGGYKKLNDRFLLWLPPSFGMRTKIGKYLGATFSLFFWFLKLLKLTNNDTLFVYHAPILYLPIKIAKWLKKFQLILEVEEIYTYNFNRDIRGLKRELNFIKLANKLLVVNKLLINFLQFPKEKILVSYGPYQFDKDTSAIKFNDNKIHLVYAGSFSKQNSGAQNAIAAAQLLSDNYVMHILGYGDKETTDELKNQIDKINSSSKCKIIFEGEKRGAEYGFFMRGCDIALCTQKLTPYGFPSKILSYMGFGLNIVSVPLVASLASNSISNYINYYENESTSMLASAIQNATIYTREEIQNIVINLNEEFVVNIDQLIRKK